MLRDALADAISFLKRPLELGKTCKYIRQKKIEKAFTNQAAIAMIIYKVFRSIPSSLGRR